MSRQEVAASEILHAPYRPPGESSGGQRSEVPISQRRRLEDCYVAPRWIDPRRLWVGTASSRDRKAVFGVVLPASAETKVGSALDSGLSNLCAATSPNDCKVGGTVNTAMGGHRQQPLRC